MHLGDVITAASVIPVLKEQYPHSEIHYLVKDSVALPASLICGVDRVIPYTYQSGGGALDVIRMGKKWFYNLFWGAKVTVQMRVLSAPTFFSIKK